MPCNSCNKSIGLQHFRPRRKEIIPQEEECDICHTIGWDVSYCSFCKKWLCPKCAKDPVARFKGFTREMKKKIRRNV